MTREEVKEWLISYFEITEEDAIKKPGLMNYLVNLLEQELKTDILEQIKDEINKEVLESLSDSGDDWFIAEKVNECLAIIDKYRQEG